MQGCCNSSVSTMELPQFCTEQLMPSSSLWHQCNVLNSLCYASAFRRRRHYVFGLSVRPSVRPSEARNTLFPPVHGWVRWSIRPTVTVLRHVRPSVCPSVRLSVRPSVRPERFPGICRITHGGNGLKFCMLMYRDHLQNWLDDGHGLFIFLLLLPLWLSETGQIWGFRAFPGERIEGMAWNFACWCIVTTFRTD